VVVVGGIIARRWKVGREVMGMEVVSIEIGERGALDDFFNI
jgi:hypothetical protein